MQASADVRVERPNETCAVAVFVGEHDLATTREVHELLQSLLRTHDIVVADLSHVEFIDSSFIFEMVEANRTARARGVTFRLQLGTAPIVEKALEISGILRVLEVVGTREEALARRKS
jgi:anti-anti-sigma factor